MRRLLFFAVLILGLPFIVFSQFSISGTVLDAHSEEPVPFASVTFKGTSFGTLTDSAGTFRLSMSSFPSDSIVITSVGYQPYYAIVDPSLASAELRILLERGTFVEGAQVRVRVNPGLLVWRKIVQNKPRNDRYRFDNFSYELYNKLELDLKNINFDKIGRFKPLRPITGIINNSIDSAEGVRYLPTYLSEVISDYYYQKSPKKRREVIKAVNLNGIRNESVVKVLGGMDQVVNVYNNFIPVFDRQFVSPASDNGDYYYNYRVIDTQRIGGHRYFHLVFTPRRLGGDTFEGDCWVHVGSFAIQRMNLRLGKDANVNFLENLSLIQEYQLIDDSTWFLSKDKFVADISPVGKEKPGFIGRKTTTYRKVVVNDSSVTSELAKNKILEEIITLPGALDKSREYWGAARHEPLSKTESGIIRMIDTLTNAPEFQKFTRTANFIGTGYLDIGNWQIGPWMNWITSNSWEGFRLRFDLGTNKHFNRRLRFHGYLAYGFGDEKVKGLAEVFYLPSKTPRFYLYGSYINDLDFGQNYYGEVSSDNVFALAIRKQNVPIKFMQVKEKRFEMFYETIPWMSNLLTVTHKTYRPLRNLPPADSFIQKSSFRALANFEISLRLRFAFLERFLESNFYRTSLGSIYPIGEFTVSRGIPEVLRSSYSYTKISASLSDNVKIPPIGDLSWRVYAGKTFGTVPYPLLDIAPGNELYYYNTYAFNMMNRWEYVHDRYAGISLEHHIGNGLFRLLPKLKFRQFWTARMLIGDLSDANRELNFTEGHNFKSLDGKTYLELGTGIDNILHVFRLDFIWRLLPAPLPETERRFGVFGSFRLSF
jgi:hypothetical protein